MTPLRRLAALLRPSRLRLAAALACAAVAALGTAAYAFLAGPAARALIHGEPLDPGPLVRRLLPDGLAQALAGQALGALPLLLVAAATVRAVSSAGTNALLPGAVAGAAASLRARIFSRLLRADPSFFLRHPTGDLVSRATADVAAAETAGVLVLQALIKDVAQALSLLAVCAVLDARLLVGAAIVVPATVWPVKRFADRLRGIAGEQLEGQGRLLRRVEQALQGHRVVQAFGAEEHERRRFAGEGRRFLAVMRRSLVWRSAFTPVLELMGIAGLAAVVVYAGATAQDGRLPPEAVISFAAAALLLYQPLKALGNVGQHVSALSAAAGRAFELLDAPDGVKDAPGARTVPPPAVVRLEQVTVRYGDATVLDRVDLELKRGETVALVGESGAGKTTVANLLLRFVDPTEGRVTLDGVDVREITLASLRSHVGYVPQDSVVFADTVRANVACGAALPDGAVRRATAEARADEWIARLPGGHDGELSERGANLSGGERQRLGIARALARDARVLVLDEATSSLDAGADALLQEAFARALSGGRIGLVISHRLASLQGVDRVVVLDRGRIVEQGSPDELLAAGGRFARLWRLQAGAAA